jgi:nucleotide-binding universal stress UspA family protein
MFKYLLIATDGSQESAKALAQGIALAKALSAKVIVATVTESWTEATYATIPTPSLVRTYEEAAAANAAAILERAREATAEARVQCVTRHVKDTHAPEGILKTAKEEGCDLIIVGSHGHGILGRILLGSTSLKVLTHSTVPVLVCR